MRKYKSNRKYKCPYCTSTFTRNDLPTHIEKKHEELIPEDYSPARVAFDSANGKNYGTCMICKADTTEWDEKLWRYKNLCVRPSCRQAVSDTADKRMLKVYNTTTLLYDPGHQEKMLSNRKISGKYRFQDGNYVTYTGQYEKKLLEFMDLVMNIESKDIQCPGPTLEYEYEGKKHFWITDCLYIPANLIIEVKDGGVNPNNRTMTSYREKQVAKEEMVTNLGTFNYLRLTNNSFDQLLLILAELKMDAMEENNNTKVKININEVMGTTGPGGMPPQKINNAYVIPYGYRGMNDGNIDGYAFSGDMRSFYIVNDDLKIDKVDESFFDGRNISLYTVRLNDEINKRLSEQASQREYFAKNFFLKILSETPIQFESDIDYSSNIKIIETKNNLDAFKEEVFSFIKRGFSDV